MKKGKARLRFMETHPPEKWSSGMLVDRVRELEALVRGGETEAVRQMSDKYERAREARDSALAEVRALREVEPVGVAGERVAGRKSLSDFRRETWARFASAVVNLPLVRASEGVAGVRLQVALRLDADLYLLGLTAPRGTVEATERDRLRRLLDSPPFASLLSRPERWADRLRVLFLSQVARTYYRPSIWAAYERSSEDAVDRWGTVVK